MAVDNKIEMLNSSIKETISLLRQLKGSFGAVDSDYQTQLNAAEQLVEQYQRLNRLLAEKNRLQTQVAKGARIAGGHPDQAGYGEPPLEPNQAVFANNPIAQKRQTKLNRELAALERAAKAEEKRATQAEEAAKQEKHLQDARYKVANSPEYRQALEQAQARGLGVEHLQSIEDRGGDVQHLRFANRVGGINNQFNPYVNTKTGTSTPGLSSQFRSFGSDILRDIGQFTKWSIAVAAVYTPMQKLGELITLMIDNESKLADATIAANIPFEKSGQVFDDVAVAANNAGESISTTIDAYTQAVRAAGRYNTEEEKSQKANSLLADSLILSKLSALDQADAIDTLSAALLQSDRELDQGQELLNKWVRVSQVANVGIDALATGVAVLGDAAETSGLDIDHLNALIAVLSEQSISGSKEAANTAKALIGSYQSDKAEIALSKYGIALRKANGEVRGFLEIYQELAKARKEGVLSEPSVSELALALGGGGARRAKDASALINSQDRLNQLAKESSLITGDSTLAQDSLAKKLETVQTASTRLGNAWQELAQTLGDDGGLLDLFKGMINGLTGITSAADDLFTLLGRSGPVLATFTTAMLAIRGVAPGTKDLLLSQLGAQRQFQGFIGGQAQYGGITGYGGGVGGFARGVAGDVLQMNQRGGAILGGAAVGVSALSNLQAGKNENAIANVIGGLIGGAIGSTLGGGIGIAAGATIGSSVADSFVNGLSKHSTDLADYFAGAITAGKGKTTETAQPNKEITTEELIKQAYQAIGGGSDILGEIRARIAYANSKTGQGVAPDVNKIGSYATSQAAALDILKKQNPALYTAIQEKLQVQKAQEAPIPTSSTYLNLQKMSEVERAKQLQRVSTGEITSAQFQKTSENLGGFPTRAIRETKAFGDEFIRLSKDIDNTQDVYKAFLELSVNGTADQISQINSYTSDIEKLQAAWDKWTPGTKILDLTTGTQAFTSRNAIQQALQTTQQQAAQFTNNAVVEARLQQLKLPGIVGSATEATSGNDIEQIKQQASKLQQQFYKDIGLTDEEVKHVTSSLEDFSVLVGDAAKNHFDTISVIDQKFWDAAQKLLSEQGKIKDNKGLGFQKYDVGMGELSNLAAQSLNIGKSWQQKFNYDFKPEDQIAIDNTGIVQPLHADFKILALLLEKLNEKAQKQLDGQYNIPEGATFWVPLTAAYYRNQASSDTNLTDALSSLDLGENTSATDANTVALNQLTAQYQQGDHLKREYGVGAAPTSAITKEQQYQNLLRDQGVNKYPLTTLEKKSEEAGYGLGNMGSPIAPPAAQGGAGANIQSLLDTLKQAFMGVFTTMGGTNPFKGNGTGSGTVGGGIANRTTTTTAPVSPTTKLDLKISSNINLQVDGRILASTLQSYLASELLKTEQSQGTISKRFVI